MDFPKFSVLMSIYIKEKSSNFIECMESIVTQTVPPSEIVIVFDGPISNELENTVDSYIETYPGLIKIKRKKENKGLGLALADGILECSYELIARMDTDDICRSDRFEKQLTMFMEDPDLDICGSQIAEFERNVNNVISKRIVPIFHDDIVKYQRQRSAFNHVTVMFKKAVVLKAGNYEDCLLMEDDMLWVRMILAGAKCANIDEYLVYVRTGYSMIDRRGGWPYYKKYKMARKRIYDTGFISKWDYLKTLIAQIVVSLIPTKARKLIFLKLLR